jgi:spore germination protein YaaH
MMPASAIPVRLRWSAILLTAAFCVSGARAQRPEALWYIRNDDAAIRTFIEHADRISIISPQVFSMDSTGMIRGRLDPRIIETARAKRVKLVPLVMNPGFNQQAIHRVLNDSTARARGIRSVAALCRDNKFDGIQFDFENFHVVDKDAFTSFAREAVDSVHRAGCTLSAAVVPRLGENRGTSEYHQWIWDNWRGAFDYKALADTLDFISYMTYAQHTGGSTPGPVAGMPWVENCLRYLLSLGVPPSKVSLGLAGYSDYWFPFYDVTKDESRTRGNDIGYARAMQIVAAAGARPVWDDVQKAWYAMWENHGVFEHLWIEDARAFFTKADLVGKYKLRGYSVWLLGLEDPATWERTGEVAK